MNDDIMNQRNLLAEGWICYATSFSMSFRWCSFRNVCIMIYYIKKCIHYLFLLY